MADREVLLLTMSRQLRELLVSEIYNFDKICFQLLHIPALVFNSSKITWNAEIKDLVRQLKLCIVYNTPEFYHLFNYKTSDPKQPIYDSEEENSKVICKRACVILGFLADKISAKDHYSFLHAILECNGSPDFRFKDLIRSKEDQKFRISIYVGYNDVFEFIKVMVCKTKPILRFAESRTTRNVYTVSTSCEVSLIAVSVEIANVIKELVELALEVLSGYSFKEENVQLSVDTVKDLMYEAATLCPLERLDAEVKNRTMACVLKLMGEIECPKEKIKCVAVVSSISTRAGYGDLFLPLWDKLVAAACLKVFEPIPSGEVNIEIGRCFMHLASLLEIDDVPELVDIFRPKGKTIQLLIMLAKAGSSVDVSPVCELAAKNLESLMELDMRYWEFEVCNRLHSSIK